MRQTSETDTRRDWRSLKIVQINDVNAEKSGAYKTWIMRNGAIAINTWKIKQTHSVTSFRNSLVKRWDCLVEVLAIR